MGKSSSVTEFFTTSHHSTIKHSFFSLDLPVLGSPCFWISLLLDLPVLCCTRISYCFARISLCCTVLGSPTAYLGSPILGIFLLDLPLYRVSVFTTSRKDPLLKVLTLQVVVVFTTLTITFGTLFFYLGERNG